jgi:hypothetical protein
LLLQKFIYAQVNVTTTTTTSSSSSSRAAADVVLIRAHLVGVNRRLQSELVYAQVAVNEVCIVSKLSLPRREHVITLSRDVIGNRTPSEQSQWIFFGTSCDIVRKTIHTDRSFG